MREESTPVLVVGGGLVGLSTSLFLSAHGVPSVLVERHPGTSIHPRAWGLYPRSLELLRTVGVADALFQEGEGFAGHNLNGLVESLAGREINIRRVPAPEDVSDISPVPRILSLSQDRIEPILLARAKEMGGDLRYGTELVDFAPAADGVVATVRTRETGTEHTIRAEYLIAADGAHSPVRKRLDIPTRGRGTVRHQMSVLFRAELEGPLRGRRFAVCKVENPTVTGILGHDDSLRQGTLIVTYHPERGEQPSDFTPERCVTLVRAAVGVPDLAVEILSALPWEMAAVLAERFRVGRVFLVGDAAHVLPPVGGYGANTGIQDAHNLAWKLAATLAGSAGPDLLDTYAAERLPVCGATMEQAMLRLAARAGFATAEQKAALIEPLTVTCGYRYRSGAIRAAGAPGPMFTDPRELTGEPGTRAPHVVLRRNGAAISTLDLFGTRPVLLAGADGEPWCAAAERAAATLDIPLRVHRVGGDLIDTAHAWHAAYGVEPAGAVLVRPDGFVCWRSHPGEPAADQTVHTALAAMYAR
ncbi:FAD-dependent monooxygenase [Actinomycetes bacterium KLBMP 9797]